MNVRYSKSFQKSFSKLSGKLKNSVANAIKEVKEVQYVEDITDCKKLENFDSVYRVRIGSYRAFFTLHFIVQDNIVYFQLLVPRGQAYGKKTLESLKEKDSKDFHDR